MTLEEMQAQLDAMRQRAETAEAERDTLKKNQSNQNSYITKLEQQRVASQPTGQTQSSQTGAAQPALDPAVTAYLQKKMRDDVLAEAESALVNAVGKDVYDALKPDLTAFVGANMKTNNTTVAYVIDAFALVHGKAIQNKDHAVHKIGQTQQAQAQQPATLAGSAAAQLQGLQQAAQAANQRAVFPNVMTPSDASAASGPPGATQGVEIKSTKEAINSLKAKFLTQGGNRFGV